MRAFVFPGQGSQKVGMGADLAEASTAAREVFEESGITVRDVRYHSSQPWPFPTSLMLGFYAEATSTEITINEAEMEDVRWFEKSFLLNRKNEAERINLPRKVSIARQLIDGWLGDTG